MSRIFVTSDTHFGHENIIRYCNRPFGIAAEMGEVLIERWNARVGVDDTVYFLGDLAMGPKVDAGYITAILLRLNGNKKIVLGNHDQPSKWGKGLRAIVAEFGFDNPPVVIADQIHEVKLDGKNFVMCHFPLEEWPGKRLIPKGSGAIHLHGHTHTEFNALDTPTKRREYKDQLYHTESYDIGVDMYGGPVEITGDLCYLNDPKGWN